MSSPALRGRLGGGPVSIACMSLPRLTGEVRWGSGQHRRFHCAAERRQGQPEALEPAVMFRARLQLQYHPLALDACELRDLGTRYEQARVGKAAAIAVPAEHRHVSAGRWPKAAPAQMNAILDIGLIPAARLDLKTQK